MPPANVLREGSGVIRMEQGPLELVVLELRSRSHYGRDLESCPTSTSTDRNIRSGAGQAQPTNHNFLLQPQLDLLVTRPSLSIHAHNTLAPSLPPLLAPTPSPASSLTTPSTWEAEAKFPTRNTSGPPPAAGTANRRTGSQIQ